MEIIPNWHPVLVHFTVALYVISAGLFAAGYFVAKEGWKQKFSAAAYLNLWLGAAITVLTVAAGIYAYNTVGHDAPSHLAMTNHRNWALLTAGFFWVLAIWSVYNYRLGKMTGLVFVVAMLIGAGLVGVTGFKGGEIVYRYGLGVMSLPEAGGEGHSHSHEGAAAHDHGGSAASAAAVETHDDNGTAPHSHDEPQKDNDHDHDH